MPKHNTHAELVDQMVALREKLNAIEGRRLARINRKLLGRCFRFKNSSSMPQKPSDYWFVWIRVIRIARGGGLHVFRFHTDRRGCIEIDADYPMYPRMVDGFEECSPADFDEAWLAVVNRVDQFNPGRD